MQIGDLSQTHTPREGGDNAVLQGMRILLVIGIMAGGSAALWLSGPSPSAEGMITAVPPQTLSRELQTVGLHDRSASVQLAGADTAVPLTTSSAPGASAGAVPKDAARAPTEGNPVPLTANQASAALPPAQAALEQPAPPVPIPPIDMDMTGAVTQQASLAASYAPAGEPSDTLVDLNTVSFEQLNSLRGAGALGRAIIKGRPYKSVDDLMRKKVLRRTAFEKIKGQVTVQ